MTVQGYVWRLVAALAVMTGRAHAESNAQLAYLQGFLPTAADDERIAAAVRDLADDSFAVRQRGTFELQRIGPKAATALRKVVAAGDAESAHRARECLRLIDRDCPPSKTQAVLRRIASDPPASAGPVLLAFLPHADEAIADDVQAALDRVAALGEAQQAPIMAALSHPNSVVRASAAVALVRSDRGHGNRVQGLLADADPVARMRVGLALATQGNRGAMKSVLAALPELPTPCRFELDDVLVRLAGDTAPEVDAGDTPDAVKKHHDAWQQWWERHGAAADLDRLRNERCGIDSVFVAVTPTVRGPAGSVIEIGFDGKTRKTFSDLQLPGAFEALPRQRLLVAETLGGRVTERDMTGRSLWEKPVRYPVACQRLSGGRVFIAARHGYWIYDRSGKELTAKLIDSINGAGCRRDGSVSVALRTGVC